MKTLTLFFILFSSISFALETTHEERAQSSMLLSEMDSLGNILQTGEVYRLYYNMREGVSTHFTSFSLCTLAGECETFWITKQKEQLRCDVVRYTSVQLDSMDGENTLPSQLILDEIGEASGCQPLAKSWQVHLLTKNGPIKSFKGLPEN